jgi:hypothetical protein
MSHNLLAKIEYSSLVMRQVSGRRPEPIRAVDVGAKWRRSVIAICRHDDSSRAETIPHRHVRFALVKWPDEP